jgi:hypothetical protein
MFSLPRSFGFYFSLLLLSGLSISGHSQTLRDPTLAPPELVGADGKPIADSPLGAQGMAVVVRNGKPFLVVGTRLYAQGQKVGQMRVERITETEVWLREGKELRKVPRFSGIQRTVSAPLVACKPKTQAHSNSKASKPVACDSTQP